MYIIYIIDIIDFIDILDILDIIDRRRTLQNTRMRIVPRITLKRIFSEEFANLTL